MKTFLATDHDTRFLVSKNGATVKVQRQFVCTDENGGMDFEFRTIAIYTLKRMTKRGKSVRQMH